MFLYPRKENNWLIPFVEKQLEEIYFWQVDGKHRMMVLECTVGSYIIIKKKEQGDVHISMLSFL